MAFWPGRGHNHRRIDATKKEQRPEGPVGVNHARPTTRYRGVPRPPRQGSRGRFPKPHHVPPPNLGYAMVVKERAKGQVVHVTTRLIYGTTEQVETALRMSPVDEGTVMHPACPEGDASRINRQCQSARASCAQKRRKNHNRGHAHREAYGGYFARHRHTGAPPAHAPSC